MNLDINGEIYDVPAAYVDQLSDGLGDVAIQMYEAKLDDALKSGLMVLTRALLVKEELSVRAQYGKEAARAMRPPPKSDPNIWLFKRMLPTIRELLKYVNISIQSDSSTITAFNVSFPTDISDAITSGDTSGGQVDTDRNKWVWQDNRA